MEEHKLLVDRKTSASLLSISLRSPDSLIASKRLPVKRLGRRVLIHRRDLELFASRSHPEARRTRRPDSSSAEVRGAKA